MMHAHHCMQMSTHAHQSFYKNKSSNESMTAYLKIKARPGLQHLPLFAWAGHSQRNQQWWQLTSSIGVPRESAPLLVCLVLWWLDLPQKHLRSLSYVVILFFEETKNMSCSTYPLFFMSILLALKHGKAYNLAPGECIVLSVFCCIFLAFILQAGDFMREHQRPGT